MAHQRSRFLSLALLFVVVVAVAPSCKSKSKSPTAPTPPPTATPTPTPPPTPTTGSLSGTVTDAANAAALSGAAVAAGGKTATTGADGRYSITDLAPGSVTVTAQRQGHRNASQSVTIAAGANTSNIAMTPAIVAGFQGTWTGTWTNTTFGSAGSAMMTVAANTLDQTLRITFDLNGIVFGASDPPAETFNGTYTTAGATINATSPVYGTVSVTISPTGQVSGSATSIPNPNISRVDMTGTATPTSATVNSVIRFPNGTTANAVMTMTKQGGASTASVLGNAVLAKLRSLLP